MIMFQGKTMYQAEIDICELVDFYRFNVEFVQVACDASNDSDLNFFQLQMFPNLILIALTYSVVLCDM